jgi:hypothetical protein
METRGRKSVAEMTVVALAPGQRMEPPKDLSPAEADYWRAICATKPADWWKDDSAILLKAYCRAAVQHDAISAAINAINPARLKSEKTWTRYERMKKVQALTSAEITSLATKMRLAQQSRYTEKSAATADRNAGGERPWAVRRTG